MIEMLGVLAIIGVLSAGGIMGYSVAMENYKVNQTVDDIRNMAFGIRNIFTKYTPVGITNQNTFRRLGILPEQYKILSTNSAQSRFGTKFLVEIRTLANNNRVVFAFYSLSYKTCTKLITRDWNNVLDSDSDIRIAKNNNGMYALLVPANITPEKAKEYCNSAADTNAVFVTYYYKPMGK